MKKNSMMINILLAVVLLAGLLTSIIWKAWVPNVVLPQLDPVSMVAITLITLVLENYIAGRAKRSWMLQILFAGVTFGGLSMAAGLSYAGIHTFVEGAVIFGIVTFLFDSMGKRLEVTTENKRALIPTAFIFYLACQCFMGMF